MLTNRFYLGELTDGEDGWVAGKHKPFIEQSLWDRAEEARKRRRTSTFSSRPHGKRVWSLTGLTLCWRCQERIHTQYVYRGEPRLGCYGRQKGLGCEHKSASLSVYESQAVDYLAAFCIPPDYQQRILEAHADLETKHTEIERDRKRLEAKLKRARELYEWGDFTKAEYMARRSDISRRLDALPASGQTEADVLATLAEFLADVPAAWAAATQEQRNKLARTLFDEVWLQDKEVVAVKPRRELDPFFRINYEESEAGAIEGRSLKRVESYREPEIQCWSRPSTPSLSVAPASWSPQSVSASVSRENAWAEELLRRRRLIQNPRMERSARPQRGSRAKTQTLGGR